MKNQLTRMALREAMREPELPVPPEVSMEEDTCTCPRCKYNGPKDEFMLEAELDEPAEAPESDEDY
jgi:hypothetical protein